MRMGTALALGVLAAWCSVAVLAGGGTASTAVDLGSILAPPSLAAPCGYDDLGRALGARIVAGARLSLATAVMVVALTATVGTAVGVAASWRGGLCDVLVARLIDVFLAFPGILLAIALAAILGPGIDNVVIALGAVGWVGFARLARAQTLALKHRDHVQVGRALGTPSVRIVRLHVLPLLRGPLVVEATFAIAAVIVAEAGLSFLGLGVQPPTPSWGALIRDGTRYLLIAPHLVVAPGLALLSVVVAVNLLGDRLRDHWLPPRR